MFEELVDRPPTEWPAALDARCGDNADLRQRVHELLMADTTDRPASIERRAPVHLLTAAERVERIGGYRITRVLGSGGMGTVFEAQQDNPRRTVALKVLRTLVGSADARQRLEFEAETLARLHHPGVAQVFEAGTWSDPDTGEESPFFAMEYVADAEPLDEFARAADLSLAARLEIFITVCDAVQHGHQVGVLHRDLKPANILVGKDGRPKVIDFGIARAVDPAQSAAQTLSGQVLGTLGYMSPEQLDGAAGAMDVRSDVYALGATLYQLLVGQPPHERGEDSLPSFVQRVRQARPPRPSSAGHVPAELDWVVLRALDPDPERRYPSVLSLAEDLQRFLRREPVAAKPPSTSYVVRKFVDRHRVPVAIAVASLVLLITATLIAALGWQRAAAAEADALDAASTARIEANTQTALTDYLLAMIRRVRPEEDGREARIVDMLAHSQPLIADLAQGRPQVAARLRKVTGDVYTALGLWDEALAVLQPALDEARTELGRDHWLTLQLTHFTGATLGGLARHEESIPLLESAVAGLSRDPEQRHMLAAARHDLAVSYQKADRPDDSERELRAAEREFESLSTTSSRAKHNLLQVRGSLCALFRMQGRLRELDALAPPTLAAMLAALGPDDEAVVGLRENLALASSDRGDHAAAVEQLEAIVASAERTYGASNERTLVRRNNLAVVYRRLGRIDDAVTQLEAVWAVREGGGGNRMERLTARFNLASTLEAADQLDASLAHFGHLFEECAGIVPETHWLFGQYRKGRGTVLRRLSRFDDAERDLLAALPLLEGSFAPEHRRVQAVLGELVALYEQWEREDDAAPYRSRIARE